MDKIYPEEHIQAIANAIRRKNGRSVNYLTSEMAGAIDQLVSYPEPTGTEEITENGIVDVKDKAYAEVNVPNSYVAADEGKVVSNGALVTQTSTTKTANGTYDTTENNEVVVNVPQPSGNINITDMQSTDVSAYATAQVVDADLVAGNIKKDVDILGVVGTYEGSGGGSTLITKTITQNGTYDAADDNADGYSDVTVNVSGGGAQLYSTMPSDDVGSDGDFAVVDNFSLRVLTHTPTQNAASNCVSGVLLTPTVDVNVVGVNCFIRSAPSWSAKIKNMSTGEIIWQESNILTRYTESWNTELIAPIKLEAGVQYKVWTAPSRDGFKYITGVDPLNPLTSITLDGFLSSSTRSAEPNNSDNGRLSVSIITDEGNSEEHIAFVKKETGAWSIKYSE